MRFLFRSLMGVVLMALTAGLIATAGFIVKGAFDARFSEEPRERRSRERVFTVNVIEFEPKTLTPEMRVFGQIESRRALDIRAATGGSILSLNPNFQEGGVVTEGDLLVALDPADAQSAYDRARNDMTEAQAELRDAERGLVLSQSDLEGAQTQLRLRERALARQRDLKERGVGTDASIETAELNVASARQSVITRSQSLAQAEARVDQAKTRLSRQDISLAEAQRRLDDTKIYAGFSGTLSDVTLVEGGRVNAGERLAQLVDPSQLDVAFRLSTSQYARLLNDTGALRDAPVTIALDVLEFDLSTGGRISRESAVVGEGQTGRLLFASLESAAGFRPGDFVTVTVTEPSIDRVALLPASAVNGQSQVLVVGEEERLSSAEVSVVRRQGDDVIVRARLRGQRVVAERAPVLGEGIKVRVLSPSSAGTQTQAPQLVSLTPERRARIVAFVQGNKRMPAEAKERVLTTLEQEQVPLQMVERIEARMGS